MKHIKKLFILALPLIASCSNSSYKCFFGAMINSTIVVNDKLYEDSFNMHPYNRGEEILKEDESKYKAQIKIFEESKDIQDFFQTYTPTDQNELNKYSNLEEDKIIVFFSIEIPKNYSLAQKESNTQQLVNGREEIVTENFYYFSNDITRAYIHLKFEYNEESISAGHLSFFYHISSKFNYLEPEKIKVMYEVIETKDSQSENGKETNLS